MSGTQLERADSLESNGAETRDKTQEAWMSTHLEGEIHAAAFLWCQGYRFLGVANDPERRGRKLFEFADPDRTAAAVVREYLNGATVCAKQYASSLKELKAQLYASKDENENGNRSYRR